MKGSGLKVAQIKDFLKASYEDNPPQRIGEYQLDTELSNKYGKVYFSISNRKVIIVFRGTKELSDWKNNMIYGLNSSAYKLTSRYKTARRMYERAKKKYKGYKSDLVGHSQAGLLVNLLLNDKTDLDGIALNPAYKGERQGKNEYIIRSSLDPVSALKAPSNTINKVFYPSYTKKHNITIPAKTMNPLTEHSIDILNRLPQDQFIGRVEGGCMNKKYIIESQFPFDS